MSNDKNLIKQLRDLLVQLLPEIELGKQASDALLNELGLFLGMRLMSPKSPFLERTQDGWDQKLAIAEYLLTDDHKLGWASQLFGKVKNPKQIFFECGSTIDPIVGGFADKLNKNASNKNYHKPEFVVGNNLFILTALVHLIENVGICEGYLRTRYFGILPYADEGSLAPDSRKPDCEEKWHREFRLYDRMCQIINESDVVYATCSNFSLLAGPLVGSRSNAIAKHAMYMGRRESEVLNQEFVLAFHFEKLIPLTDPLPPIDKDFPGGIRKVPEMKPPRTTCRYILGRPSGRRKLAPKVNDTWHSNWCNREREPINAGELQPFVAYELESAYSEYMGGQSTYFELTESKLRRSWAECAKNIRILISLPDKREPESARWLEVEVAKANELLGGLPNPIHYELALVGKNNKIAELRVLPGRKQ